MKKKTIKKKVSKQIVEIHIYIHKDYNLGGTGQYINPITNPPYIVTC